MQTVLKAKLALDERSRRVELARCHSRRGQEAEPSAPQRIRLLTSAATAQGARLLLSSDEGQNVAAGRAFVVATFRLRFGLGGPDTQAEACDYERRWWHELASKRLPLPRRERAGVRVKTCGVSSAANSPLSLCPARNYDAPLTGPIPSRQSTSTVSACPMPQLLTPA